MKLPITKRLLTIASMIPKDSRVADIGCDHGYLGIYLLQKEISRFVVASDLNPMPLESAKRNAEKFGVFEKMSFVCNSGLRGIDASQVDTVVCAGMGGDLMRNILDEASWVRSERYTLLLQPQSGIPEFRKWLGQNGFTVLEEQPIWEDEHIYFVVKVRYTGKVTVPTPGELFVTDRMLQSESEDLARYLDMVLSSLTRSIEGMQKAAKKDEKLDLYLAAKDEIVRKREAYEKRKRDS